VVVFALEAAPRAVRCALVFDRDALEPAREPPVRLVPPPLLPDPVRVRAMRFSSFV
jgi:hypothetical protein